MNWHDSECSLSFIHNFCVKWWIKWQLETKESISGIIIKLLISSVQHSMIHVCCLVPSRLATIQIYPDIHVWMKSLTVSCFQFPPPTYLSDTAPAFIVPFLLDTQSLRSKAYYSDPWRSFFFLFPNFQMCSLLNLPLCIPCLFAVCNSISP